MSIYRVFTFDQNDNIVSEVSEQVDNEKEIIKSIEDKFEAHIKNEFINTIGREPNKIHGAKVRSTTGNDMCFKFTLHGRAYALCDVPEGMSTEEIPSYMRDSDTMEFTRNFAVVRTSK